MYKNVSIRYALDWTTIFLYVALILMGWVSIYGASYNFDQASIFDFSQRAGKQFLWILTAFAIGGVLLLIDAKMYNIFAYFIYVGAVLLLFATIFLAHDIKGSRSWLVLGPISFQPAELAKMATALALAKYMSAYNYKLKTWKDLVPLGLIIFIPFILIIFQNETGTALVYVAFLLMLYREGMNGIILLIGTFAVALFITIIKLSIVPIQVDRGTLGMVLGMAFILLIQVGYAVFYCKNQKEALILLLGTLVIGAASYVLNSWFYLNYNYVAIFTVVASCIYWLFVELFNRYRKYWFLILFSLGSVLFSFSADYLFSNVLEEHQQVRIKVLLNMDNAPLGAGYNVNQSKIAIGSGGFWGKGFLNGTQTKLKFVPEQDTDFIFCTVGEEHGFLGSTLVLFVYWLLLMRILRMAERQHDPFSRVYAYCVASILFFHLMINIGMVLGIMPVIGIPLPFFSYGGSSLWGFTILLFTLLRLDAARSER
ncbi:MAG: rod shape-determining protein RodA [Bacteroidota bacterium]|nr:rod shape-determining protein RodA [Bacteroidota bacterium]